MDTVLVKLYAQFEMKKELITLLQGLNDVSISEVEPVLQATGQYNALCLLYKQQGDNIKLLECWAKYALSSFSFGLGLNKVTQANRRSVVGRRYQRPTSTNDHFAF